MSFDGMGIEMKPTSFQLFQNGKLVRPESFYGCFLSALG